MLATTTAFEEADVTATMRLLFLYKLIHFQGDFGNSFWCTTQVLSRHTSSLTSDHPRHFELFRPYFLQNLHISANPYQNKPFQASNTK